MQAAGAEAWASGEGVSVAGEGAGLGVVGGDVGGSGEPHGGVVGDSEGAGGVSGDGGDSTHVPEWTQSCQSSRRCRSCSWLQGCLPRMAGMLASPRPSSAEAKLAWLCCCLWQTHISIGDCNRMCPVPWHTAGHCNLTRSSSMCWHALLKIELATYCTYALQQSSAAPINAHQIADLEDAIWTLFRLCSSIMRTLHRILCHSKATIGGVHVAAKTLGLDSEHLTSTRLQVLRSVIQISFVSGTRCALQFKLTSAQPSADRRCASKPWSTPCPIAS